MEYPVKRKDRIEVFQYDLHDLVKKFHLNLVYFELESINLKYFVNEFDLFQYHLKLFKYAIHFFMKYDSFLIFNKEDKQILKLIRHFNRKFKIYVYLFVILQFELIND